MPYKCDKNLNTKKVFQFTQPTEIDSSSLPPLSKGWVRELSALCYVHNSVPNYNLSMPDFDLFSKHLSDAYPFKLHLEKSI